MTMVAERPVLVAPDSFKGTFRAAEVAAAIGRGLERAGLLPPDLCPLADGGEGTMEALLLALGGETHAARVRGPLGAPVDAAFALVEDGGTAILEMAAASGLALVPEAERDAWAASTYGTGELICAAVDAGAQVVIVGVGGSATTDGGAGALEAIEEHGGLGGVRVVVLTDVRTPWERAPAVFGPQKGADPALVTRLDEQTLEGKLVGEIGTRTRQAGVPLHAIVGTDALDPFGKRMIDLQLVQEATNLEALEAAGERLGEGLRDGRW